MEVAMKKLWLLPCLAASLMAADVSGKWTGNIIVEDPGGGSAIDTHVRAEIQQKPDAITGAIGRQEDKEGESIRNAKLDGNRLTFEVSSTEANSVVKFALTLDGDRLNGEMTGEVDGLPVTGKVHLTRQPQAAHATCAQPDSSRAARPEDQNEAT
jgi:hypothetical protein